MEGEKITARLPECAIRRAFNFFLHQLSSSIWKNERSNVRTFLHSVRLVCVAKALSFTFCRKLLHFNSSPAMNSWILIVIRSSCCWNVHFTRPPFELKSIWHAIFHIQFVLFISLYGCSFKRCYHYCFIILIWNKNNGSMIFLLILCKMVGIIRKKLFTLALAIFLGIFVFFFGRFDQMQFFSAKKLFAFSLGNCNI